MASMGNAQRGALGGLAKLGEGARTTSDLSRVGGGLSRGANEGKKLNAAPWSDTWPAAGATLDLDFANNRGFVRGVGQGGVMDAITFTRASNGNFVNEDGLLVGGGTGNQTAANLLNFPQDFDNAAWSKTRVSVDGKANNAPNNTLTANKVTETATFGSHYIRQTVSVNASSEYTISFYIKAGERTKCAIFSHEGSPRFSATIDLTAETITEGPNFGTATYISSSINDEGDGWYRCSVTGTYGTAFNALISFLVFSDTGQESYAGDGESGIFIWGAQLEVGSTATEYFPTNIGEPRFDWASTEQIQKNLLSFTENLDLWEKLGLATVTANGDDWTIEDATTDATSFLRQILNVSTNTYTLSAKIKKQASETSFARIGMFETNGLAHITFSQVTGDFILNANAIDGGVDSFDANYWIVYVTQEFETTTSLRPSITPAARPTLDSLSAQNAQIGLVDVQYIQLEIGASYTSHEAVAQPTTLTPLRANPTSNGILIEEARTNRLLWNRDATQTQWVKTNITAVKDQAGIDGVANAASSLTATDDNGTCIQTITLAAGNRTGSVYLKRLTGTGNIQVTLDGSTYSTVDLSDTEWYRIVLSGSVTNPTVGIKIAVDGDAVAMDYGQVEDGLFVTTPILTTTATATRAIDSASVSNFTNKYWMNQEYGTINIEVSFITNNNTNANFTFLSIDNGSNNWFRLSRSDSGGAYLRLEWAYRTTLYGTINQNIGTNLTGSQQLSGTSINKIAVNMQPNNYIFSLQNENVNFKAESRFPNTVLTKETGTLSFGSMSWIKRLVYFPKTTNDNQLEAITR
jgi:hypothetical protein